MTVFSSHDIKRSISRGEIGAVRGDGRELSVEPASLDLHLGDEFKAPFKYSDSPGVVKVDDESTYPEHATTVHKRPYLDAGKFCLGTTEETVTVPDDKVAVLHGRSSVGRLGLFVHNAGYIDPGFSGEITLELYNAASYDLELVSGMRIAQLSFHDLHTVPDHSYSHQNGNKYDGQTGTTESRLYEDFH